MSNSAEGAARSDRARSFGGAALDYAEHRPDYPRDAVAWGLAPIGTVRGHVVDLAAGTGLLTGVLLGHANRVTAVEPDARMRAEFSRRFPEITVVEGHAESMPLETDSIDAVFVGQAFHWFDVDVALTEIARVLRPGGTLVALWNREDTRDEWVVGYHELTRTRVNRVGDVDWEPPAHRDFTPFERRDFPHAHRRTADSLIRTMLTHSRWLTAEPRERDSTVHAVRTYLSERPETANGREFDFPLVTMAIRAVFDGGGKHRP